MIYPSKVTKVKDSTIAKLIYILSDEIDDVNILDLYNKVGKFFDDIGEFISAVECLYILDCLEYKIDEEGALYVKTN